MPYASLLSPVREEPDSKAGTVVRFWIIYAFGWLPVRESLAGKQKNRTVLCHMSLTCPLTYYQSKACKTLNFILRFLAMAELMQASLYSFGLTKTFLLRQMGLLQEEGGGGAEVT